MRFTESARALSPEHVPAVREYGSYGVPMHGRGWLQSQECIAAHSAHKLLKICIVRLVPCGDRRFPQHTRMFADHGTDLTKKGRGVHTYSAGLRMVLIF
jgi:hypothetical protein